ncbi:MULTISPECIES: hypothetical protein [unclassified Nocardiopsis]|uniref:hypothetical protein n=1 Tax=Nocardiopsis TaxID=2013 RepID=UPI00387B93CC
MLLLLVGVGTAVALNAPREYVSFPDCDEVFDAAVFERAAQVTGLEISGGFEEDDGDDHGSLGCDIAPDDDDLMLGFSIAVEAFDPQGDEWEENVDDIEEMLTDAREQLAQGERGALTIDDETIEDALWRTSSAGDTGIVIAFDDESLYFSAGVASNAFLVDNLGVAVVYLFEPGAVELEDAVNTVHSLGDEVERALRRTGETA